MAPLQSKNTIPMRNPIQRGDGISFISFIVVGKNFPAREKSTDLLDSSLAGEFYEFTSIRSGLADFQ
jgi:hypothetical protein